MSENSGPVIYVGPAYKDTEIHTNQIFADGIPAKYKDDPWTCRPRWCIRRSPRASH